MAHESRQACVPTAAVAEGKEGGEDLCELRDVVGIVVVAVVPVISGEGGTAEESALADLRLDGWTEAAITGAPACVVEAASELARERSCARPRVKTEEGDSETARWSIAGYEEEELDSRDEEEDGMMQVVVVVVEEEEEELKEETGGIRE